MKKPEETPYEEWVRMIDFNLTGTFNCCIEFGKHMISRKSGKIVNISSVAGTKGNPFMLHYSAAKAGVITQMGNQGHTTEGIRLIKEWYDAGVLGDVKEVHAWHGKFNFKPNFYWTKPESFPPPTHPIPDHLDWDLWLGPAKYRNFNSAYAPLSWRGFYDFGNGMLGDWSCHTLDGPFWSLDLGMPKTVEANVPNPMTNHSFIAVSYTHLTLPTSDLV